MSYPWHSTKYLVHIISGSLSCTDINSVSVELCASHFIIFNELIAAPSPLSLNIQPVLGNLCGSDATHPCTSGLWSSFHLHLGLASYIVSHLCTSVLSPASPNCLCMVPSLKSWGTTQPFGCHLYPKTPERIRHRCPYAAWPTWPFT